MPARAMGRVDLGAACISAIAWISPGYAEEGHCIRILTSSPLTILKKGDASVGYRLSSSDPAWPLQGLGWHATSAIECQGCEQGSFARAVAWLGAAQNPTTKPATHEGDPYIQDGFSFYEAPFDHAAYRGSALPLKIDDLQGWLTTISAYTKSKATHDIVQVELSDGCVHLDLRIEAMPSKTDRPIESVMRLLRSLRVTKVDAKSDLEMRRVLEAWSKPRVSLRPLPRDLSFAKFREAIDAMR